MKWYNLYKLEVTKIHQNKHRWQNDSLFLYLEEIYLTLKLSYIVAYLNQSIPYLIILFFVTKEFGLIGAAIVWSLRVFIDFLLLLAFNYKVRKNILFSKFLSNYLNISVYFMVLFAEKSQKMVLLVKTDRLFNSLQVKRWERICIFSCMIKMFFVTSQHDLTWIIILISIVR